MNTYQYETHKYSQLVMQRNFILYAGTLGLQYV
jgi:hypothetical protein